MKKIKAFLFVAVAVVAAFVQAATETVNGVTWTYTVSSGKASVGGGSSYSPAVSTSTSGAITIPSTLGGYPVTSIGDWAFRGCGSLTSVTIPDSVTNIGSSAFRDCGLLTSVTIPDNVTNMGDSVFRSCVSLLSVELSHNLTKIPDETFYNCRSLTSVVIPDRVKLIGITAFCDCFSLRNIIIPDGVTTIYSGAFDTCTSLVSVTIPDSVTTIEGYVFYDCKSLTSVTIPNNVTRIGSYTFIGCKSLTSITIPKGVGSIGDYAFKGCKLLTKVIFEGDAPEFVGVSVFYDVHSNCTMYVKPGSTGWGVDIPGKWNGVNIDYIKYCDILGDKWKDGFVGDAQVIVSKDETIDAGESVKFTAGELSSAWIETEVTNSCRVTFKWKSSCEPLVKGSPYDYLSFEVDDVQKGFICGETPWAEFTVEIAGDGVHCLRWCF